MVIKHEELKEEVYSLITRTLECVPKEMVLLWSQPDPIGGRAAPTRLTLRQHELQSASGQSDGNASGVTDHAPRH